MTGKDLINRTLLFEAIKPPPKGEKRIVLFDIDGTLLKPYNIFMYKKTENGEEKITPEQFDALSKEKQKEYDLREFRDPEKIKNSILGADSIYKNIKIVDAYANAGWDIGILTARAFEDVVHDSLQKWLMYRDKEGNLQPIKEKLSRKLVFAVNDDIKKYSGADSSEKKANVIMNLIKENYNKVVFIDDSELNLAAVKKLIEENGLKKKVVLIKAWK